MTQATAIKRFSTTAELRRWRRALDSLPADNGGHRLGFVPTMGALHDGHMALVERALAECRTVIVSIFVNPLQFGANEDLDRYPRTLEKDLERCRQAGVHAVFHPSVAEMYPAPAGEVTTVVPPARLTEQLCGLFRPGHFSGVATVVAKLFSLVEPDAAYFGQKDYQQLTVIRQMVADLNLPLAVVGVPTVREPDGLALSSRNVYLSPEQRRQAPILFQTLSWVRDQVLAGGVAMDAALEQARQRLSAQPGLTLQYLQARDPDTLGTPAGDGPPFVLLVAARFGDVRLIDNLLVTAG